MKFTITNITRCNECNGSYKIRLLEIGSKRIALCKDCRNELYTIVDREDELVVYQRDSTIKQDLKVLDTVRIVDEGDEYTSYEPMMKHLLKKSKYKNTDISDTIIKWKNQHHTTARNIQDQRQIGTIIALDKDICGDDDIICLVKFKDSLILINKDGLEKTY